MLRTHDWRSGSVQVANGLPHYTFPLDIERSLGMSHKMIVLTNDQLESNRWDWVYPEQEVKRILVDLFKEIPQVKSICTQFDSQEITIWTLLESYDRKAREKVYEKELEVSQKLGLYNFDFRVTSIDLISPDELIRSGSHQIYKRQ